MPKLIKDGALAEDKWQLVEQGQLESGLELTGDKHWLVPLSYWNDIESTLEKDQQHIGVWVDGNEAAASFRGKADRIPLIAIKFPVFTDGRGFSLARQLREQHDFKGELRAMGYFLQDQLFYLSRCGFNAFLVKDDANIPSLLESLHDFSNSYQAAVDEPRPLFRRRA